MARGPAPGDLELFAQAAEPGLRLAARELAWLLSRGYTMRSALSLVGDRHALVLRQRKALERGVCADEVARDRRAKRLAPEVLASKQVAIDGFNALILAESILGGAVLVRGLDGALRDLAGVHGTWRPSEHSEPALRRLVRALADRAPSQVDWVLDAPISNSGRLAQQLRAIAMEEAPHTSTAVHLAPSADRALRRPGSIVVSSDAWVLDGADAWCDLLSETFDVSRAIDLCGADQPDG